MALVPFSYNLRSLLLRRSATFLTVLGIGATVAVVSGVLALQQGFETLFTHSGRSDVYVVLRKGAISEGESAFTLADTRLLMNSSPEIAADAEGHALASAEIFLAVLRGLVAGGDTNVPIRGVQPASFALLGDRMKFVSGRNFTQGADEVIVGRRLVKRIADSELGDVIKLNKTPFRVVGVFECDGPFESEIWGDVERMKSALERPVFNRVICQLKPGVSAESFKQRVAEDKQTPADVYSEAEYLENQTKMLSGILIVLGAIIAVVMGIAAIFTATNTMLAALAARSHEIGILLSVGFRPGAIFVSFLGEALLLCLLGGVVGTLLTLPVNGIETGTANFQTFTDVAFAFRITPRVLITAISFATILGLIGGAWPAWRAARMSPTQALRRQ